MIFEDDNMIVDIDDAILMPLDVDIKWFGKFEGIKATKQWDLGKGLYNAVSDLLCYGKYRYVEFPPETIIRIYFSKGYIEFASLEQETIKDIKKLQNKPLAIIRSKTNMMQPLKLVTTLSNYCFYDGEIRKTDLVGLNYEK